MKMDFNSILNLDLYLLHVVGEYRIHIEFFPWKLSRDSIYLFDLVH